MVTIVDLYALARVGNAKIVIAGGFRVVDIVKVRDGAKFKEQERGGNSYKKKINRQKVEYLYVVATEYRFWAFQTDTRRLS